MPEAITLRQWTDVVRRARLGRIVKMVALALATYADADGSRVYPGIARLSYECELSYTGVKKVLRQLRGLGLIEKVGRRGDADVYQLILHEDLLERVNVPTPSEVNAQLDRIRKAWRGTYIPKLRSAEQPAEIDPDDVLRSVDPPADTLDSQESAGTSRSPQIPSAGISETSLRASPRTATTQDRDTTTTTHYDEEVSTHVLVPGDPSRTEDQDSPPSSRCQHGNNRRRCVPCRAAKKGVTTPPDQAPVTAPELGPKKCPEHGLKGGTRPDGKPHCTICRQLEAIS